MATNADKKPVAKKKLLKPAEAFDPETAEDLEAEATVEKSDGPEYDPEIYAEIPGAVTEAKKVSFLSHLFKLTVAKCIKNTGLFTLQKDYHEDHEEFSKVDHMHWMRTIDSEGKQPIATTQVSKLPNHITYRCSPIAGHFHLVTMELFPEDKTKAPVIKAISGPMIIQKTKVRGKVVMAEVPANDYDSHKHKIAYERSQMVEARKANNDAKVVAARASTPPPKPKEVQ